MKAIVTSCSANAGWFHNISSVADVCLITDSKAEKQYVGSDYGVDGCLGDGNGWPK